MASYVGNKKVNKVFVGDKEVQKIYVGSSLVYQKAPTISYATVSGLGSSSPSSVTFNVDSTFPSTFEEVTIGSDVFVKFPKMYRKVNSSSTLPEITSFTMATGQPDSTYHIYPCFLKEDGVTEMDYILVGKYMISSTTIANSVNAANVSIPIGTARQLASAKGAGYQLYDWMIHKFIQDLAIITKRTINTNPGQTIDVLLGIAHQQRTFMIDGVAHGDRTILISYKPSEYADEPTTALYSALNYNCINSTTLIEVSHLGYDTNNEFANFPTATFSVDSYNTYYCDSCRYQSGNKPISCCIGYYLANNGVFQWHGHLPWTQSTGARLCYRPI